MATNLGRIGFVPKGNWVAGTYKFLDVVRYNGGTYACQVASTANNPSNTIDWMLLNSDGSGGQAFSYVGTWAGKPESLTNSYTDRIFITDIGVGGSEWYWDGTRYRVVGGQVVLKALSSSDTQPTFNWTGTALTIDNTLFTIPAGLLNTGNIIDVEIDYTCTSGTITTPQIYTRSGGQTVGQGGSYTLSAGDFAVGTTARVSLFSSYRLDSLTTVTPLRCGNGGTFGATYSGSIRRGATIPSVSNTALDITSRIFGGATTATIVVDGLIVTLKTCG